MDLSINYDLFSPQTIIKISLTIGLLTGSYFVLKNKLRQMISKEANLIVNNLLISPELQASTTCFVHNCLNQPHLTTTASQFVISILNQPEVQNTLKMNIIDLFSKDDMKLSTNQLVVSILQDPTTQTELQTLITTQFKMPTIKTALVELVTDVLNDNHTQETILLFFSKDETRQVLSQLVQKIVSDPEMNAQVQLFLIDLLKNARLKDEVYVTLKSLFDGMMKDIEFNQMLVTFLSQTLMSSLNEPVNEKFIKDKITELLTSDDIMNSVSTSIMEVVQRDELKKTIGDHSVEALTTAIKKHYPRLGKWV